MRRAAAFFFGAYLLLLCLLNLSFFRQGLAHFAAAQLEKQIGAEVEIESIDIGLWNRVTLHGVKVYDRQNALLFDAGLLSAKIKFIPLLGGQVSLRTVVLLDATAVLYKEEADSESNYQFIVDAFSNPDTARRGSIDLTVGSLVLRRCALRYDSRYLPETPGTFSPAHIALSDIHANIALTKLTADSLNLRIRALSMKEQSGLSIEELSLRLMANRNEALVSRFMLRLPGTRIAHERLVASYSLDSLPSTLAFSLRPIEAELYLPDFQPFFPRLETLGNRRMKLTADADWKHGNLHLRAFEAETPESSFVLKASGDIALNKGRLVKASGSIAKLLVSAPLQKQIYKLATRSDTFPAVLETLGNVELVAELSGIGYNTAAGALSLFSDFGTMEVEAKWDGSRLWASVASDNLNLAPLQKLPPKVERCAFNAVGSCDFTDRDNIEADVEASISSLVAGDYAYAPISLIGSVSGKVCRFEASISDLALQAETEGRLSFSEGRLSDLTLSTLLRSCRPALLHWTDRWGEASELAAALRANVSSFDLSHLKGEMSVSDFHLLSDSADYFCNRICLSAEPAERGAFLRFKSDFAEAEMNGPLDIAAWRDGGVDLLFRWSGIEHRTSTRPLACRFTARLWDERFLRHVLQLPLSLEGTAGIDGTVETGGGRISLTAQAPAFSYGNFAAKDAKIYLYSIGDSLSFLSQAQTGFARGDITLEARINNVEPRDSLFAATPIFGQLKWTDAAGHYSGSVAMQTFFDYTEKEGVAGTTLVRPTTFTLADTLWQLASGRIEWSQREVSIEGFSIGHDHQWLTLTGHTSATMDDAIVAELNDLDIAPLISLARLKPVSFAGRATGAINVSGNLRTPIVEVDLGMNGFCLNDTYLGDGRVGARWDADAGGRIELRARFDEEGMGSTNVDGFIDIEEKNLELNILADRVNVEFLHRYTDAIFRDLYGRASGRCRLFGPLKSLDLEGEINASLRTTIIATGVRYLVDSGHVTLSPGTIRFENVAMRDVRRGTGIVAGTLHHEHFSNLSYSISGKATSLMVYDQPQTPDMPFYATAAGTGSIRLEGHPGDVYANIDLTPVRGTVLTYLRASPVTGTDDELLAFGVRQVADEPWNHTNQETETQGKLFEPLVDNDAADIRLEMQLNVTPEANLIIMLDEKTGDRLDVRGSGAIQANYYNKDAFQLYGTYTIEEGTYHMSMQEMMRKTFTITSGGTLTFYGDPMEGNIDMQAVYTVPSASLADLNVGTSFSQQNIRVNCLLHINGKPDDPKVDLDLDFPTLNDDEKQMIRSLIATQEDINLQTIYLLGLNRFYSTDYTSLVSSQTQSQSTVMMRSFLTNTFSQQLNNIVGQLIPLQGWSLGANVTTGSTGWDDMGVEGQVSGRMLRNRLLFNGNIGYRESATSYQSNFIGDFDLTYILTRSGGISLKAYSKTNDRYFTKSSLTTQGVGVVFKRDFFTFSDLFRHRR